MPNDALRRLQAAARDYANLVCPGSPAKRVCVLGDAREVIAELMMPACLCAEAEPSREKGWDLSGSVPRFDGDEVPVAGKPLAILKLLAADDGPVKTKDLRRLAWDKNPPDESTVRQHVMDLRDTLAKHFSDWSGEFIATTPHGYHLVYR